MGWDEAWRQGAEAQVRELFAPLRSKSPHRCDIYVKPFFCGHFDGVTHGLIYEAIQPEEGGPVFESVNA